MARIVHVLTRFSNAELTVHRLYVHDSEFRSICDDYEDAVAALRHWEGDEAKAGDFRRLASEIEGEIAAFLQRQGTFGRPPD